MTLQGNPGWGFLLALGLALPGQGLWAQEGDTVDLQVAGSLSITLGDRTVGMVTTSSIYDTVRVGSASLSPVNPDDTGPNAPQLLSVLATATPEGGAMVNLMIEFAADPTTDGVVTLAEYADDMGALPFWSAGAPGRQLVSVTIDRFVFDGGKGHVSGTFAGELCKTADWGAAPDPADCQAVSGRFDSEVYQGL